MQLPVNLKPYIMLAAIHIYTVNTIPSGGLQVLALSHRMFDYYTVYYSFAQIQLEAEKYHQHSPCKMVSVESRD